MSSTDPKQILPQLHLVRAALIARLLTKEQVIDWATSIVEKDEKPDIFFIDLMLPSTKSLEDTISYFSHYLNFESPVIQGRPLLGFMYQQYKNGRLTIEQAVRSLLRLKYEMIFSEHEEGYIYLLDHNYDMASDGIYGSLERVKEELGKFLTFYRDYSLDNASKWPELDKAVDQALEQDSLIIQNSLVIQEQPNLNSIETCERSWWKRWISLLFKA